MNEILKINDINSIEVYYHDELVGTLVQNDDFTTSFTYSKTWLRNGFSISPFRLPLKDEIFICKDYLVQYMFGVFLDSLPDSWGNSLNDRYLLMNGINPTSVSLFERLSLLGKDVLGALTYKPSFVDNNEAIVTNFDNIKVDIDKIINNELDSDSVFLDIFNKGNLTGGSRPKINCNIDGDPYIVKFRSKIDNDSVGKEEYELNNLASECGMNVNESKLIPSKLCDGYFAAKRFDRNGKERIHVISLAGLFDLRTDLSQIHYKGFLQVVYRLCPEDSEEAVRRMIFNYLIDNKDDHPRNFSFYYDEANDRYRLTPFFDITSTPYINEHMMQVNDKDEPTLNDFIEDAKACGVDKKTVIQIYNEIKLKVDKYYSNKK